MTSGSDASPCVYAGVYWKRQHRSLKTVDLRILSWHFGTKEMACDRPSQQVGVGVAVGVGVRGGQYCSLIQAQRALTASMPTVSLSVAQLGGPGSGTYGHRS